MEGDLARVWKRLKKKYGWDDTERVDSELRENMVRFAPVPQDMGEELAGFYLASPVDEEKIWKSEEILELLAGTWEPSGSALEEDDWDFLKDLVNAWALELDMDVVTDVMRVVVDRGGFGEA